jgi:hypothetical protein
MKKNAFLIVFLSALFSVYSATAQVQANFGAKAGANFSTLVGTDGGTASALVGPHFGGIAQFSWPRGEGGVIKFAIQPELFYSMQGAKSGNDKTSLSYLNFATVVQRFIGYSGFYIETGPQIGFLILGKDKTAGVTTDIKSQLKPIDISLIGGLGFMFKNGLGINARYAMGVTSIQKDYDIHNTTIGVGLFYILGRQAE